MSFSYMMKKIGVVLAASLALMTFSVSASDAISDRLAPVGTVCMQGESCAAGQGGGEPVARTAESIFNTFCAACHATGALGAPKKGDDAAWKARVDAIGGFDALVASAIKGKGAMPAKGLCADCSDDEISGAVKYMSGL